MADHKQEKAREHLTEREREALAILARGIVREAGIAQEDHEAEARLEGNKMAMEAAKTQLLVGSGLLVGMGAVVGIMPDASLASPLLYFAFAFVVLSVYCGMVWMRDIAAVVVPLDAHLHLAHFRSHLLAALAFSILNLTPHPIGSPT